MFGVDACLLQYPGEILDKDVSVFISKAPKDSQLGTMEGEHLSHDTVRRKQILSGNLRNPTLLDTT